MLRHYAIVAVLHFGRAPVPAALNVLTLGLGLFSFIVAHGLVNFWTRAEQQFANAERIFVVTSEARVRDGMPTESGAVPSTNHWLAQYLKQDFPQLEAAARATHVDESLAVRADDRTARLGALAVDGEFLDIFDLPFVEGDARDAARAPKSVILTAEAAQRLFGEQSASGSSIVLGNVLDATVTGVIAQIPEPSHMGGSAAAPMQFDVLLSRDLYEALTKIRTGRDTTETPENWLGGSNTTYLLLPADGSLTAETLREQLPAFVSRHVPEPELRRYDIRIDVMPVASLLSTAVSESLFLQQSGLSVQLVVLFLGSLILAMSCVNFANLATARASGRVHEVGLRKALGARSRQVLAQNLVESTLLTIAGVIVALASLLAVNPILANELGIDFGSMIFKGVLSWVSLVAIVVVVVLAAGAYPAIVLSRVRPAPGLQVMRARTGPRSLAMFLVGVQFAAAVFLLAMATVAYLQSHELRATAARTGQSLLAIENDPMVTGLRHDTLRNELLKLDQVMSTTMLAGPPWMDVQTILPLSLSQSATAVEQAAIAYVVGVDFFTTFDVKLLAGRLFDDRQGDNLRTVRRPAAARLVLSRSLAEGLGATSPASIVDKTVYTPTSDTAIPYDVIGVVEDHALSISSGVFGPRPSAYLYIPEGNFHVVRLNPSGNVSSALTAIDVLWQQLVPSVALNRRFALELFEEAHANFARLNNAITGLTIVAVVIATLGLFAIADLVASRRVGEIAIRKTLGANGRQMLRLLLLSFLGPVIIANLVALPFAYAAARNYLEGFLDPIELTLAPFVASSAVATLIAIIAVARQAIAAAMLVPSRALRNE